MNFQVLPAASFNQAWSSFWDNLFNFRGRATRAEYWWISLIAFVAILVVSFVPFVGSLASIAIFVLTLGLYVRRFHDAGFSTVAAIWVLASQVVLWGVSLVALVVAWAMGLGGGDVTLAGGVLIFSICSGLASAAVLLFGFVVTLLPSRPANQYGPQRAGRVPVGTSQTAPEGNIHGDTDRTYGLKVPTPPPPPPPPPPPAAG